MRKLLYIVLLLPVIAFGQVKNPQTNFSTVPTGSQPVTLTNRVNGVDSASKFYWFYNGKYFQFLSARQTINYLNANLYFKSQVDSINALAVHKAGTETITGIKNFTNTVGFNPGGSGGANFSSSGTTVSGSFGIIDNPYFYIKGPNPGMTLISADGSISTKLGLTTGGKLNYSINSATPVTLADASGLAAKLDSLHNKGYATLQDYGADYTGTVDATTAFRNAAASGKPLYVFGTYKISDSIQIVQNIRFESAVINFTGVNKSLFVLNFQHDKHLTGTVIVNGTGFTSGTAVAVHVYSGYSNEISGFNINNFAGTGIQLDPLSNNPIRGNTLNSHHNWFYGCYRGYVVNARTPTLLGVEYSLFTNNVLVQNAYPIITYAGNSKFSDNNIVDNTYGVQIIGGGLNDSHDIWSGNMINHNGSYEVSITNIIFGESFSNNSIFGSSVIPAFLITNSPHIMVEGGFIDGLITLDGLSTLNLTNVLRFPDFSIPSNSNRVTTTANSSISGGLVKETNKDLTDATITFPTFNQNTTGNAATSTNSSQWGGLISNYSSGVQAGGITSILGVHNNGTAYGFNPAALKSFASYYTSGDNASFGTGAYSGAVTVGQNVFLADATYGLVFGSGTTSYILGSSVSNYVDIYTNSAQRARFSSSGLAVNGTGNFSGATTAQAFVSNSAPPTATVGTAAGTGATVSFATGSTNQDGKITINCPNTVSNGAFATVTMSGGFAYAHACTPVLQLDNAVTGGGAGLNLVTTSATTTGFTIFVSGTTTSGTYIFNYHNGGY